jgi:hypothetical protein
MKYISKDIAYPTPSPTNGFWVKEDIVYDVTFGSHVGLIIEHPELFGLTGRMIMDIYKKHGEAIGSESKAREELVGLAASNGWIRVRRYSTPKDFFSIQTDDTKKRRKDIIAFVVWALGQKIMMPDSEAKILSYNNPGDCQEYKWADGGITLYLSENKE